MSSIRTRLLLFLIMATSSFWVANNAGAGFYSYEDVAAGNVSFTNISEESSTDEGKLYGQPTYFGNNQLFFPTTFISTATEGTTDSTIRDLSMTISTVGNFAIQSIVISEYGNYALSGDGTDATSASITSTYTVFDRSGSIAMSPKNAYALPIDNDGAFNGSVTLDFSGLGITELGFFLSNDLETSSEAGTTAQIQKSLESNQINVEIYTAPIPIPGAVGLMITGLLAFAGFRRRS